MRCCSRLVSTVALCSQWAQGTLGQVHLASVVVNVVSTICLREYARMACPNHMNDRGTYENTMRLFSVLVQIASSTWTLFAMKFSHTCLVIVKSYIQLSSIYFHPSRTVLKHRSRLVIWLTGTKGSWGNFMLFLLQSFGHGTWIISGTPIGFVWHEIWAPILTICNLWL